MSEFRLSRAAQIGSCQSCHMPTQHGRRQHTWPGRDATAMLRQAVSLSARLDRQAYRPGETLQAVLQLRNDAGHRFPTGDSIHTGILDVWLRDGDRTVDRQVFVMSRQGGGVVFSEGGPGAPLRQIGFRQVITFINGRPVARTIGVPGVTTPHLEAPERPDTRLLPGEEMMLVYRQPVRNAMARSQNLTLRMRVFYSAVHPGLRQSRIDPSLSPMRLIREVSLPVRIEPADSARTNKVALRPPTVSVKGQKASL